jgi:hypothetical protein
MDREGALREKIKNTKYLLERRKEIREVLDHLAQQPTEADVIKLLVEALLDPDSNTTHIENALFNLQEMIEEIDNANDLHTLGGMVPGRGPCLPACLPPSPCPLQPPGDDRGD